MPSTGAAPPLSDAEFERVRRWLHQTTGIALAPAKKPLVVGRLARRLLEHGLDSFAAYFDHLQHDPLERQTAIDLLTTNETHFFREPRHFKLLAETIAPGHHGARPLRVWSAAASTGQEPYSIAMVLSQVLGDAPWAVFGSDISSRALERARAGLYDMAQASEVPPDYLHACCLKGVGGQTGRFLIAPEVARRVSFAQVNLNAPLPDVGDFDVIFLRNVMIYFDDATKRAVVQRLRERLRPGGWFLVGHSETLNGLAAGLVQVAPSVYREPTP